MDRLLRPKIFETEPTAANSEKLYRHWKITFENYLDANIQAVTPGTPGDDASLAANVNISVGLRDTVWEIQAI